MTEYNTEPDGPDITKTKTHWRWHGRGEHDFRRWSKLLPELGQMRKNWVVDLRGVSCRLSILDAYRLAEQLEATGLFVTRRIALLLPDSNQTGCAPARFFALCGVNRGLSVRTFEQDEHAQDWVCNRARHSAPSRP